MRRPCLSPRCPEPATYRGRCQHHAKQRERQTHHNKDIYNSRRWRYLRRRRLFLNPLCSCGEIATDVDHIRPIGEGGPAWELENLQSLCKSCHSAKTRREQGATE